MEGYGYKLNELAEKNELNGSNYEFWAYTIEPYLFATGCLPLLAINVPTPVPRPVDNYHMLSNAWYAIREDIEKWDKSSLAGKYTIALNLSQSHKFLIQQNPGCTVLQLWNVIKQNNRNNTVGQKSLARQKQQS